jgi:hypothetical protein
MVAGFFGADTRTSRAGHRGLLGQRERDAAVSDLRRYLQLHAVPDVGQLQQLPKLTQTPSTTDNSGWTSLFESSANSATYVSICRRPAVAAGRPRRACAWASRSRSATARTTRPQDDGGLLQGRAADGVHGPIVNKNCNGQFNGSGQVVGFATFKITKSIRSTGTNKGISMDGICESDEPGRRRRTTSAPTVSMVD